MSFIRLIVSFSFIPFLSQLQRSFKIHQKKIEDARSVIDNNTPFMLKKNRDKKAPSVGMYFVVCAHCF